MRIGFVLLGAFVVLSGFSCGTTEPPYTTQSFSRGLSEAVCEWVEACCDAAEVRNQPGDGVRVACESELYNGYQTWLSGLAEADFRGDGAQACVAALSQRASSCPRSFDPDELLRNCDFAVPSLQAGDSGCTDHWQCSTRFCKSGICTNPLALGRSCVGGEICAEGLRCIGGVCAALQPDGAFCQAGNECISGTCGGGECVVSTNYTCDGK